MRSSVVAIRAKKNPSNIPFTIHLLTPCVMKSIWVNVQGRWPNSFQLSVNWKSIEHCRSNGSIKASILHQFRPAKERIQRIRLNKVTRQTDEETDIRSSNHTLCSRQKNGENVRIFFDDRTPFHLSMISVDGIGIWLICLHEYFYGHNIFTKLVYVLWHSQLNPGTCWLFGVWQFHIFHSAQTFFEFIFCTDKYAFSLPVIWYSVRRVTHKYKMFVSLSACRRLL